MDINAAVAAISNPLIEDPSIKRASGLIVSITGGNDLTLFEVDEAATRIREQVDQDANIIIGATAGASAGSSGSSRSSKTRSAEAMVS